MVLLGRGNNWLVLSTVSFGVPWIKPTFQTEATLADPATSADSQLGPEDDGEQSKDDGRCQTEVQVEEHCGYPCDQPHGLERGQQETNGVDQIPDSWDSFTVTGCFND